MLNLPRYVAIQNDGKRDRQIDRQIERKKVSGNAVIETKINVRSSGANFPRSFPAFYRERLSVSCA